MRESWGSSAAVKQWPRFGSLGRLSQKFASDDDAAAESKEESQKMNIQVQCPVVEGS